MLTRPGPGRGRPGTDLAGTDRPGTGDQTGSGTAIGVAVIFPALVMVITLLSMMADSARTEQTLQTAAHRAARTASLCCHYIDDVEAGEDGDANGNGDQEEAVPGAVTVARASLAAATASAASNQVFCVNDMDGEATISFSDMEGNQVEPGQTDEAVPVSADQAVAVPAAGLVTVQLTCELPAQTLGGFGWGGLTVERRVRGLATVDPNRSRSGAR